MHRLSVQKDLRKTRAYSAVSGTTSEESGSQSDPYSLSAIMAKKKLDMTEWSDMSDSMWKMKREDLLEKLRLQIQEFNLADWGELDEIGLKRYVIDFDVALDVDVLFIIKSPTNEEQEAGSVFGGGPYDNNETYNHRLIQDLVEKISDYTDKGDGSGPKDFTVGAYFAVPMAKWYDEKPQGGGTGDVKLTAVELFSSYIQLGICIVKPKIVVCIGKIPVISVTSSTMSGVQDRGLERAPGRVMTRRVVLSKGFEIGRFKYVEVPHPFVTDAKNILKRDSMRGLGFGTVTPQSNHDIKRNIDYACKNLNDLETGCKHAASAVLNERLYVNAFSKMMGGAFSARNYKRKVDNDGSVTHHPLLAAAESSSEENAIAAVMTIQPENDDDNNKGKNRRRGALNIKSAYGFKKVKSGDN